MLWRIFGHDDLPTRAEIFRRFHERWLTKALKSRTPYPRIPVRRVDQGGFDDVRARPEARARADRWWELALDRVDSGLED